MKPRLARHCNKAGNGTLPVRQSPPHKPGLLAKELHSVEKHLRTISLFGLRPNQEFPIWPSERAHNAQMEPLQRIISVYKAHLGSLVHQLPSILKRFRAWKLCICQEELKYQVSWRDQKSLQQGSHGAKSFLWRCAVDPGCFPNHSNEWNASARPLTGEQGAMDQVSRSLNCAKNAKMENGLSDVTWINKRSRATETTAASDAIDMPLNPTPPNHSILPP